MDAIGRQTLPHDMPLWVEPAASEFFVTICCQQRGTNQLCLPEVGEVLMRSVRFYYEERKWYPEVFLLMPDHLHMLVSGGREHDLTAIIGAWKRYTARQHGIVWQRDFFEHRLRANQSAEQKYQYILHNPVRAGLVEHAEQWSWVWTPHDDGKLKPETTRTARRAVPTLPRAAGTAAEITLSFQPVQPDQAEELLAAVRRYYAEDDLRFEEALVRHAVRLLLSEPSLGRAFFLRDEAGNRAGYAAITFGFDHEVGGLLATVTDLFIEPTHRRQGYARQTLRFLVDICRALGVRQLELQPERHNLAGQALYRSFGFREHERIPMFLPLD